MSTKLFISLVALSIGWTALVTIVPGPVLAHRGAIVALALDVPELLPEPISVLIRSPNSASDNVAIAAAVFMLNFGIGAAHVLIYTVWVTLGKGRSRPGRDVFDSPLAKAIREPLVTSLILVFVSAAMVWWFGWAYFDSGTKLHFYLREYLGDRLCDSRWCSLNEPKYSIPFFSSVILLTVQLRNLAWSARKVWSKAERGENPFSNPEL